MAQPVGQGVDPVCKQGIGPSSRAAGGVGPIGRALTRVLTSREGVGPLSRGV